MLNKKFIFLILSFIIILSNLIISKPFIKAISKPENIKESKGTGIKLTIKEELIDSLEKDFIPQILQNLKNFSLTNQTINYDLKITTLKINLDNIKINLNTSNFTVDNFKFNMVDPNKILLKITDLKGDINFDDKIKLSVFSTESHVNANLLKFNLNILLALNEIESKKIKGQMLPSLNLENIDLDFDFNYDISGDFISRLANYSWVKSIIIKLVKSQINSIISSSLKKSVNDYMNNLMISLPPYLDLKEKGLSLDYGIMEQPKVTNNSYLTINSKGLIVNTNISETLNPPFNITKNIEDFDFTNNPQKNVELILSDYSLNSGLFTLFMMDILKININSEILPENFPVKINTTTLNVIFNGISDKYGEDIPSELLLKIIDTPKFNFKENAMNLNIPFQCSVFVLPENTEKQLAIEFNGNLSLDLNLKITEKGKAEVNINTLDLSEVNVIQSNVEKADLGNVQELINFVFRIGVPILNKNYLNSINFNLPKISGIDFSDMNLILKENFIDLHLNPNFEEVIKKIIDYFIARTKK
jgi:hypothetical protein